MRIGEATNPQELVGALEDARNRRINLRRPWETMWWNNIALVAGDHFTQWNPTTAHFEDVDMTWLPDSRKKPKLVINHALVVVRKELAKLTKSRPIMEVIANSDEPKDIAATKVGKAALDYVEWKFKRSKHRKQALWWMSVCGLGSVFVGWDPLNDEAGHYEYVIDPTTDEPTFDPDRKRELQRMHEEGEIEEVVTEKYPLGELDFKVFSPFQLLPDENALDFEDIQDLITSESVDIDALRGVYGRAADDVKPEEVTLGGMEQQMLRRTGLQGMLESRNENAVQVHTYWLLPNVYRGNKFLEQGIYVRWCQGRKLLDISKGAFPYSDNRIPHTFYTHIPNVTSIWPDSVVTHIRGPNLEIDKTTSQLIENKDFMANPMWLIATQHKIKGEIKNVAGSIVRYVHVPNIPPPQPVEGMQLPNQVENLIVGLRAQILDISGQSEIARGRVPTGVRSGVAVAYLQEEDDTTIAPTVENMEFAIALEGSLVLSRMSQFYSSPRILRYYRADGQFDVMKFKGADLKNNTDVICQAGSAMPKSKAARQQYTLELVSLGVLTDPRKINEMLDIGQGEPDDTDKAISQANRENNIMLHGLQLGMFKPPAQSQGQEDQWAQQTVSAAVPVKRWHNHQLHIARHTSQMMDEEFDTLQISHPQIVRLFDEHLAMHQQMLKEEQAQQIQALLAAKGAPGGTPAGDQANGAAGGPMGTFMNQTSVPDIIGGGQAQLGARTIRPMQRGS